MTLENEIFRRAGLIPRSPTVGNGYCGCDSQTLTTLYKANGKPRCDVCSSLNQVYPNGDNMTRLTDGSFLLITPTEITFWGKSRLDKLNPNIKIRSATGEMTEVIIGLIRKPPDTPWMAFNFSKSNSASSLRVTEDNRLLRFGGKLQIRKQLISEINREQVMQMADLGLSAKEWDQYMQEYATGTSHKIMKDMERKHPKLSTLRHVPPLNSPEYLALSMIIRPKKGEKP